MICRLFDFSGMLYSFPECYTLLPDLHALIISHGLIRFSATRWVVRALPQSSNGRHKMAFAPFKLDCKISWVSMIIVPFRHRYDEMLP